MENNKILDKLEKLLALSQSPEPAEAERAMALAISLATKHQIDLSRVTKKGEKIQFEIVEDKIPYGKRMPVAQKWVANILIKFFDVRIVYHISRKHGGSISFIGEKSKVHMAERINVYLNHMFLSCWQKYQKQNKVPTGHRDVFMMGMRDGIGMKMRDSQQKTESENLIALEDKNQYGIVLASMKEQVEKFMKVKYEGIKSSKLTYNNSGDNETYNKGFQEGQKINFNSGELTA